MRFSTSELAEHLGGALVGPDVTVDGASIDSRTLGPGQLFVPIAAERDGHSFIAAALDAGAPAYLTSHEPVGATAVVVDDTAAALLRLGTVARDRTSRRGDRHHRLGGQDDDEGARAPLPGVDLSDRGERALLQQRARAAAHAAQRGGRRALGGARDGRARRRPHRAAGRGGAARGGDRDAGGDGARRVSRGPRRGGAGQERAGDRAPAHRRRRAQPRRPARRRHARR